MHVYYKHLTKTKYILVITYTTILFLVWNYSILIDNTHIKGTTDTIFSWTRHIFCLIFTKNMSSSTSH